MSNDDIRAINEFAMRKRERDLARRGQASTDYTAGFRAGIEAAAKEADRYQAGHKKIGAPYEAETFATLAVRIRNIKPGKQS